MPNTYFTRLRKKIISSKAYAKTGAPMFTKNSATNINATTFIYILNLEYDKIYIGKTTNFKKRMKQHIEGCGSKVTQKFKPLTGKIICICNGYFSNELEQTYTKKYIKKYGYQNVRGGSYTNSITFKKKHTIPKYIYSSHR